MSNPISPLTFILAEDNRSTRRVVRNLLDEYDTPIELIDVDNGDALTELYRSRPPGSIDLVILDLNLLRTHKNGLSGLQAVQKLPEPIPFIVLTVDSTLRSVRAALAAGALGYCVKPPTAENLLPAVEVALAHSRLQQTYIAIGALMACHHLTQEEATSYVKSASAAERRIPQDIAQGILNALEANRYLHRLTPP
ncbi:MAG: response regulator [Gammaproteobacteria bacterium]|nr:response regulator [Gammaproteobacteria bacterium]MCP5458726.1 response regulator [Gammaproteobacteria bacterium]